MSTDEYQSETDDLRRSAKDGNIRERLLEVATQLFTQHGYEGTSMAAIAEQVGVTPPAVYWHFESKSDLLAEVLLSSLQGFSQLMLGVPSGTDPSEELRALSEAHVSYLLDRAVSARLYSQAQLVDALPPERRMTIVDYEREYKSRVKSVIQRGMVNGVFHVADATPATFAIIYMCENVTSWFNHKGSLSIEEVAQMYGEFAIRIVTSRAIS